MEIVDLFTYDKDLADSLTLTFTDLNPNNISKATRVLFEIFEEVGIKYCEKMKKEFPRNKVITMRKLFDEFDRA